MIAEENKEYLENVREYAIKQITEASAAGAGKTRVWPKYVNQEGNYTYVNDGVFGTGFYTPSDNFGQNWGVCAVNIKRLLKSFGVEVKMINKEDPMEGFELSGWDEGDSL